MTKAKRRNVGQEILQGIREIKRGAFGRVVNIPSVATIRESTGLSQSRFAQLLGTHGVKPSMLLLAFAGVGIMALRTSAPAIQIIKQRNELLQQLNQRLYELEIRNRSRR